MNYHCQFRKSLIPTSVLFVIIASAATANAAAPHIIIFYAEAVSKPLILAGSENLEFMVSIDQESTILPEELKGRPFLKVAFFWGPKWLKYMAEGKPLEQLKAEDAEQRGRYYPATEESEEAMIIMDLLPPYLANQTRQRQVSEKGIEILKKYKVPVFLPRRHV